MYMRVPRMHGFPPHTRGSTVTRLSNASYVISEAPPYRPHDRGRPPSVVRGTSLCRRPIQEHITLGAVAEERSGASSLTNVARNVAQALTPGLSGYAMDALSLGLPFVLGGGLKIVYDLLLLAAFRGVKPPEERPREAPRRDNEDR